MKKQDDDEDPLDASNPPELPKSIYTFLLKDTAAIRNALLPLCISNNNTANLFRFLLWENQRKAPYFEAALLEHIVWDIKCVDDVVDEMRYLAKIITTPDSLLSSRLE